MKKIILAFFLMSISFFLLACSSDDLHDKKTITVAAAASLTSPMTELAKQFELDNPDYHIVLSFASSGSLLKQIEEGAPIDIFLSASTNKFNSLLEEKISKENSKVILSNAMTLITYKDKEITQLKDQNSYNDFIDFTYSIGDPESVPAGRYSYEILSSLDIWKKDNPNQITAKSVRQVVNYVESKNVEYGIVYSSDAFNNDKVRILKEFDKSLHSAIYYPIGMINGSINDDTRAVYDYIISDKSMEIFLKYGFKKAYIK